MYPIHIPNISETIIHIHFKWIQTKEADYHIGFPYSFLFVAILPYAMSYKLHYETLYIKTPGEYGPLKYFGYVLDINHEFKKTLSYTPARHPTPCRHII
jgi:hypothetical protein